jgi:TetR/AcrR family transcriptional regulator, transcriptional repressor for nem operon
MPTTDQAPPSRAQPRASTSQRALDVAEELVQRRGYNGFSYADIAVELGVTKASLHYHFATKADLGEALVERYSERFAEALEQIDQTVGEPPAKLAAYADLYTEVMRGKRMCLCGMLAAEYETLPRGAREAVVRFFDANAVWLGVVLAAGRADGTLFFSGSGQDAARSLLSALQGAMLLARPYGDLALFQSAAARTLQTLSPSPTA